MQTALTERPTQWRGLDWHGATVVIMASGPSLSAEQCETVLRWRALRADGERRVLVVNNSFLRAPWADALYACDGAWWRVHIGEVRMMFHGELWTQDIEAQRDFGIRRVESQRAPGLGMRAGVIHQGGNGGFQAINLAFQAGVAKIVLLGYDMHGTHWHGRHEGGLPNTPEWLYSRWIKNFDRLAADLEVVGVRVVNATPGSKLACFRRATLGEALE